MAEDLLFRDETKIVREARELVASGTGDVAAWIGRYDTLLGQYQKLLSHAQRITRISDLMQNQINNLNEKFIRANTFQAQLLDTAITGIIEVDAHGLITKANQAFCSATGFAVNEIIGKAFRAVFVDNPVSNESCALDCCPGSPLYGIECSVRKRDGSLLKVLGNSTRRSDASGAIIGGIVSIVDVTDLVVAREAARAADQAKSDFLATMSHEIRTPLNAVLGMIELLQESRLTEPQRRQVDIMRSSAEALLGLLNDILDLSRIESGKLDLEKVNFSLRDSLSGAVSLLRMRASKRNLDFNFHIDDSVPEWLLGDPNRLRQVVLNLADNAIKFTAEGRVNVSVDVVKKASEIVVLHFAVSDTGIGIPRDSLATIFDRFAQADSSMTRKYGGSGLGLAIVAQLVKAMLGSVWAESDPGKGSTFHFTIQCQIGENPLGRPARPSADGLDHIFLQGLRVLLVEDNAVNQLVAREVLRRQGCEVAIASNGKEAVEAVDLHSFDVILMDLQMPEMGGLEATRLIRKKEKAARIPIIAQTAHAYPEDVERCLAAGMDDHIPKPITTSGLLKVLRRHQAKIPRVRPLEDEASAEPHGGDSWPEDCRSSDVDDIACRLRDDKEGAGKLIDIFLEVVPSQIADLGSAVLVGDCRRLSRLAHSLKGALASFGAQDLAKIAGEIEKAADNCDLSAIAVLTGKINRQFTDFHEEVRRLRQNISSR